MSDLSEFLLARVAEDEADAREASLLPEGVLGVEETLPSGPWRGFDADGVEILPFVAAHPGSPASETTGDWGWNGGPYDHDNPEAKKVAEIFGSEPRTGIEMLPYRVIDAGGWDEEEQVGAQYVVAEIPGRCRGVARHIARHDPARVLDECAAKRQIVEDAAYMLRYAPDDEGPQLNAPRLLRLLAIPYADHPDYKQEWHP